MNKLDADEYEWLTNRNSELWNTMGFNEEEMSNLCDEFTINYDRIIELQEKNNE